MESPTPLADAFEEVEGYVMDVMRSSFHNRQDTIRRFSHLLRPEQFHGELLQKLAPQIDFDAWYEEVSSPKFGMAPAVRLQWPTGLAERVALRAELIRRIADEKIDFDQFLATFFLPASGPNAECSDFTNHVLHSFNRDLKHLARQDLEAERAAVKRRTELEEATPLPHYFVDKQRLAQLESIQSGRFDLQKLVQLCRELDFCFRNECLLSVAALTRALLDDVPPIFGKRTFANDLDVLVAEIVRLLSSCRHPAF